jgi:uncharacterized protein
MDMQSIIIQSIPILKKYGVTKAALFGSVVRGDMTPSSDIDMLVKTPEHISLFSFINIKLALEAVLGKSVDLVDYDAIKPRLKPYILHNEHIFLNS